MNAFLKRLKSIIFGHALDPLDHNIFHQISLIAFFAWVGLGADGLSSSCYGPEEAFLALHNHTYLSIFVALGTVLTIFVISTSYSQIIELFPSGGGGYLVASKLLTPTMGMVSGCALLIDYVLTVTISVASGADALFSFFPAHWLPYKMGFAIIGVIFLTLLNMRGAKESVTLLVPIFLTFVFTHIFVILYSLISHCHLFPTVIKNTVQDVHSTGSELGLLGMFFLVLRAYSLGAGTYTGIEAVSNGLPMLREPKVKTGKRTMTYMAVSLAFVVMGLLLAYLLYGVSHVPGKTLNAVLFENMTAHWNPSVARIFLLVTLVSEAAILFVAAQAGFLDGPRVLSNMALDRWFPSRFTSLSDRFVSRNGVLIMGLSALVILILTGGSVRFLIVLYSINVFITFVLSQLGMVRHWWSSRKTLDHWKKRFIINAIGLVLTSFILVSVMVIKFHEGGWITLLITGALIAFAWFIKKHYQHTSQLLGRLDSLVQASSLSIESNTKPMESAPVYDPSAKTAVLLVNGFNGLGLHTLFSIMRLFGPTFKNYVFVQIGVIDAGNFKGADEMHRLQKETEDNLERYKALMRSHGYYAESFSAIGNDVVQEVMELSPQILQKFSNPVFFGGQLVFPNESFINKILHNYTIFSMQRRFYTQGITMMVLPIRV